LPGPGSTLVFLLVEKGSTLPEVPITHLGLDFLSTSMLGEY
jgi:hypothetical protein